MASNLCTPAHGDYYVTGRSVTLLYFLARACFTGCVDLDDLGESMHDGKDPVHDSQ